MSLKVNVRHLEAGEVELDGELPAADLDLECPDDLVHLRQPVHYQLAAQKTGRDILVQGSAEFEVDCECSRCLKSFAQTLALAGWTVDVPLDGPEKVPIKDDCVDLTPFLREDILLEFPQHPLCDADCAGLPNRAEKNAKKVKGASQTPNASEWSELNKLKF